MASEKSGKREIATGCWADGVRSGKEGGKSVGRVREAGDGGEDRSPQAQNEERAGEAGSGRVVTHSLG